MANKGAAESICGTALASGAEAVLEIGPGNGALTGRLLEDGRDVFAVELDPDACRTLAQRFAWAGNFHLIHGDAVRADLPQARSLCIVGNLPYNAASPILTRFLLEPVPWERMVLMFQREVGQKLMGLPGEKTHGPLSVLAQSVADMHTILKLGPKSFWPPPKVDSIVLLFRQRPDAPTLGERALLLSILHCSFAKRRKTLANNWAARLPVQQIDSICRAANVLPTARAEALSEAQWLAITRYWHKMNL